MGSSSDGPNSALVEASGLERRFGDGDRILVAVASATCTVPAGARIGLVGPSGSGKSTLLHLLAGLDIPDAGTLSWPALGARTTLRPRQVAYVFQTPSLVDALTALENVALPLLLDGMDPREAAQAALEALAKIGLADLADKLPEELSGGQAQRIAVARALAARPKLIFADEPTGQLDHPTAAHLFDVLLAALEGTPAALVVATHDPAIARRMDSVWRMDHGVLATENSG